MYWVGTDGDLMSRFLHALGYLTIIYLTLRKILFVT